MECTLNYLNKPQLSLQTQPIIQSNEISSRVKLSNTPNNYIDFSLQEQDPTQENVMNDLALTDVFAFNINDTMQTSMPRPMRMRMRMPMPVHNPIQELLLQIIQQILDFIKENLPKPSENLSLINEHSEDFYRKSMIPYSNSTVADNLTHILNSNNIPLPITPSVQEIVDTVSPKENKTTDSLQIVRSVNYDEFKNIVALLEVKTGTDILKDINPGKNSDATSPWRTFAEGYGTIHLAADARVFAFSEDNSHKSTLFELPDSWSLDTQVLKETGKTSEDFFKGNGRNFTNLLMFSKFTQSETLDVIENNNINAINPRSNAHLQNIMETISQELKDKVNDGLISAEQAQYRYFNIAHALRKAGEENPIPLMDFNATNNNTYIYDAFTAWD